MRLLRPLALAALLALLSACSGTTFVYNRLHILVPWYLGGYVDLDPGQRHSLDQQLAPYLDWHRRDELPRYIDLLDRAEALLDGEVEPADIAALQGEVEVAAGRLRDRTLDWLLPLAERLGDRQIADFLAALADKQEEYREKYLDRDDVRYHRDAFESLRDNGQDYLGRLSGEQRDGLRAAASRLRRADAAWLAEREAWIATLGEILAREPGWQQRLRDAVAARDSLRDPAHRELYEHNVQVIHGAVAELLNSRSERQDRHLRRELHNLRRDLATLAGCDPRAQGEPARCRGAGSGDAGVGIGESGAG